MGDAFSEGGTDERPVHNVCITGFQMDVHEVTNARYEACVLDGACSPPTHAYSNTASVYYGSPLYAMYPVIFVDWNQASTFCAWAGKRLPTEAEWEYAARGGLAAKRYPWGDAIDCSLAAYGRYAEADPCYSYGGRPNDTQEVESYSPNGYGLYDMAGNVKEWVKDRFSATYYSVSPVNNPQGPVVGGDRVVRGGSWWQAASELRVANREHYLPSIDDFTLGFRCARD